MLGLAVHSEIGEFCLQVSIRKLLQSVAVDLGDIYPSTCLNKVGQKFTGFLHHNYILTS